MTQTELRDQWRATWTELDEVFRQRPAEADAIWKWWQRSQQLIGELKRLADVLPVDLPQCNKRRPRRQQKRRQGISATVPHGGRGLDPSLHQPSFFRSSSSPPRSASS